MIPVGLEVRSQSHLLPQTNLLELEKIAAETAVKNGFELCSVQLFTHLIPITMQVQIRHMGGEDVSLEDCSHFSNSMSEALESSHILNENHVLEVSSPGIGDQLINDRDFETFKGFPIKVTFKTQDKNELYRNGLLHKRSVDHVHLNVKGKITTIPRKEVIEVRLTNSMS